MAHFFGEVEGNKGRASRLGSASSGIRTTAASWDGAVRVQITYNPATGKNEFVVAQTSWKNHGVEQEIARGVVGERNG